MDRKPELTTSHSVSMEEARTAINMLIPTIEGIRDSGQDVSRRLAALETRSTIDPCDQQQPIAPMSDAKNPHRPTHRTNACEVVKTATQTASPHIAAQATSDDGNPLTLDPSTAPCANTDDSLSPSDLELIFQQSRPYSRLHSSFQEMLLSSSSHCTGAHTIISEISLSAVSDLPVVSLPISLHEVWNRHHYVPSSVCLPTPVQYNKVRRSTLGADDSLFRKTTQSSQYTSGAPETIISSGSHSPRKPDSGKLYWDTNEDPSPETLYAPEPRHSIVLFGMLDATQLTLWFCTVESEVTVG